MTLAAQLHTAMLASPSLTTTIRAALRGEAHDHPHLDRALATLPVIHLATTTAEFYRHTDPTATLTDILHDFHH